MAELFSEVRLPQSVESMLQKICIEQCKSPADTSARKQLELLGEKVSLEILGKICTQKIRYSLSGFIRCLAKDYATGPTQQGIYHSPHKRSSDDCYSPVNSPSRLKLNTGGITKGDPGEGGFGGLIRDERGMWLVGYYGKLGVCTSLDAELWAIHRGLAIAFEKGYKDLTIETNSSSAIELLKERSVVSSSVISLVDSSKFLMQRCGCIMQHVLREGNNSADGLAKLGANQAEPLVVLDEAPVEIRGLVIADMANMEESIMTETRMMQAVREELASVERRAEEERAAHNATKMAAMEREVELEQRALESSTALARIQRTADERTAKVAELEQKVALLEVECASLNQELQDMEARARRGQKKSPEDANQMIQMQAWQEEAERARQGQRDAESKLSSLEAEVQKMRVEMSAMKRDAEHYSRQEHMELEKRYRELTDLLYYKQTQLEAMASEKAAAEFQLEKEMKRLQEAQVEAERSRVSRRASSSWEEDTDMKTLEPLPLYHRHMVGVSIQNAAKLLDSGAVRATRFLWRYPIARILLLFYLVFVHFFWMYLLHRLQEQADSFSSREVAESMGLANHTLQ